MDAVEVLDVPERLLIRSVRDDRDLRALCTILVEEPERDVSEELRPLLDRIKPARPEKERHVGVLLEPERMLERELVLALRLTMVFGTVLKRNLVVRRRIVRRIRRVQDTRRAAGVRLVADLVAD